MIPELNDAQIAEIRRVKSYFPYRIVFGVINKDTGVFLTYAKTTRHTMNKLIREGHYVYTIE